MVTKISVLACTGCSMSLYKNIWYRFKAVNAKYDFKCTLDSLTVEGTQLWYELHKFTVWHTCLYTWLVSLFSLLCALQLRYKLVLAPFLQCDVCLEEILSYVFLDTIKLDLAVWYSFFLLDFAESSHCKQFNWIFLISLIYFLIATYRYSEIMAD